MADEAAQPAEGQGTEGSEQGNELYAPFLDGVDEGIHEQVIPALKAQNAEFTKRFQERSEKYGPYEEAGILNMEPEAVQNMVALSDVLNAAAEGDEDAVGQAQDWWESVGEALGFYGEGDGEQGEEVSGLPEDYDPYDPEQPRNLTMSVVQEALQPFAEHLSSREQQEAEAAAVREAEDALEASITKVQEENPDLSDDDMTEILRLAQLHAETSDDPIRAGFEQYKGYLGKGESALFASKQNQPVPAQGGGSNPPEPVKVTSANVAEIARQRLEQSMAQ